MPCLDRRYGIRDNQEEFQMEFINNDQYEDDKKRGYRMEKVVSMDEKKNMRPQFAYWEIDENTKLKLKITTEQTLELEKKYRKNLIGMIGDEDNIPPLTTMLQVVHAAAVPWQHGIKLKDIISLYKNIRKKVAHSLTFMLMYTSRHLWCLVFSPVRWWRMSPTR